MKWIAIFWGAPLAILGLWYGLSYYDLNFGIFMLRRDFHDMVFRLYGETLGMPPQAIPPLIAKAIVVDTLIVFFLFGLRHRRRIAAWLGSKRLWTFGTQPRASEDSLSSAPWRMKLAAAESIRSARFVRDTSISSNARSAATVDSRSSQ